VHLLPGLVADVEFSIHDDLHLVVRVRIDEWSASFESVESTADGLLLVDMITINNRQGGAKVLAPRGYDLTSRRVRPNFETDLL
jgi:hypothetical protein